MTTTAHHRLADPQDRTVRIRPPAPALPVVYRAAAADRADAGLAYRLARHAVDLAGDTGRRVDRLYVWSVCALVFGLAACAFSGLALAWIGVVT